MEESRAESREPRGATAKADQRQRAVAVDALTQEQLIEVMRQAEAGYPEEICGIVIGKPGAAETYRVRQAKNDANQQPQKDTTGNERDARTAYNMDALDIKRIHEEADEVGLQFLILYHSHPDHDAYFSAMDRERALWPTGEPLWPGVSHLVVSVRAGHAQDARYYTWDETRKDFVEVPADVPRPRDPARRETGRAASGPGGADPGATSRLEPPQSSR